MQKPDLAQLPRPSRGMAWIILASAAISIVLSVAADRAIAHFVDVSPEGVRDWIQSFGTLGPVVYVALMAAGVVLSPIPAVPLGLAGGLAFGVWWGTIYTVVGGQFGAVVAFTLARWLGRPFLERYVPARSMAQIDRLSERGGGRAIFFMRLIPAFNFDFVSYGAGLTSIRFPVFFVATLLGMLVPVTGLVAAGDALLTSVTQAAVIFGALVLLAVVPVAWWLIGRGPGHAPEQVPVPVDESH